MLKHKFQRKGDKKHFISFTVNNFILMHPIVQPRSFQTLLTYNVLSHLSFPTIQGRSLQIFANNNTVILILICPILQGISLKALPTAIRPSNSYLPHCARMIF